MHYICCTRCSQALSLLSCCPYLQEVKQMKAGERVLIIGNSQDPYLCVKKDEKAFINFWGKHIFLPVPDYASRRVSVGVVLQTAEHVHKGITYAVIIVRPMLHKYTAMIRYNWSKQAGASPPCGQHDLMLCAESSAHFLGIVKLSAV